MDELRLDVLIGKLETQEGRTRALIQAVKKGIVTSSDYYERAIQGSIDLGMPTEGIEIAIQRGDDDTVLRIYRELGWHKFGIEHAHQKGYFAAEIELLNQQDAEVRKETAEITDTVANDNSPIRSKAISMRKQKNYREAGELFEQLGDHADAGRAFSMADDNQKAIVNYELAKWYGHAGNVCMRIKDFRRARVNYEKSGVWELAAEASAKIGDVEHERIYRELANLLKEVPRSNSFLPSIRSVLKFFGAGTYISK